MSLSVSLGRYFEDYLARKVESGRRDDIFDSMSPERGLEFLCERDRRIDEQLDTFPESYQERQVVPGKMKHVFYLMGYSGYYVITGADVVIQRILPSRLDPRVPLMHT